MGSNLVEIIIKGPRNSGKSAVSMIINEALVKHGFDTSLGVKSGITENRISTARSKIKMIEISEETEND